MNITLDQARSLDALARLGTFSAAAKSLHKQHSALVYAIKSLENATELSLLDRSGYRTRLSESGLRILHECRRLLAVERDIDLVCHQIRTGWEPVLRLVVDGVFPTARILRQVEQIASPKTPTRIEVYAEFLSGVEDAFEKVEGDLMVSVFPPQRLHLKAIALKSIEVRLVAHRKHPLALAKRVSSADLQAYPLLTVRGSDPRLMLSTAHLEQASTIHLNDFHTKKEALLLGMGFGWMPVELIAKELRLGVLRSVAWPGKNTHRFTPHVYCRSDRSLGRAAQSVIDGLLGNEQQSRSG